MAHWGPILRRLADDLFAPLPPRGRADICKDFFYLLPIHMLAEFFMIPAAQAEHIRRIGSDFNQALQTKDMEGMQRHSLFLYDVAQAIIDDRKANPLDPGIDPTSALLAARDVGQPLPEHLILGTIRQLLVVGIIAPTTFLGSVAVHFCRHPEHFRIMKDTPERIPDVCEELLRLYTPYRGFARTPTRDVEIGGRTIRRDEPVALAFAAANRDPEVFEAPSAFRLDRPPGPPNIAFDRGAAGPADAAGRAGEFRPALRRSRRGRAGAEDDLAGIRALQRAGAVSRKRNAIKLSQFPRPLASHEPEGWQSMMQPDRVRLQSAKTASGRAAMWSLPARTWARIAASAASGVPARIAAVTTR